LKIWVGVTDNNWFEFLSNRGADEVNFWQPGGTAPFTNLPSGTPFLFKLKRPYNHIAGGGFFVKFVQLPLKLAWETFGDKNGASSLERFDQLVRPLTRDHKSSPLNIGCTILTDPFFFKEPQWISAPEDWATNIVRGKIYDTQTRIGERLWRDVMDRQREEVGLTQVVEETAQYGAPFLSRARLGQGAFRVLVTEAYKRQCAITGESTLPVLEAAHIKPFAQSGVNNTFNGLLLRSDFHKLFDIGLVTVTPDLRIEVSPGIREEWFNGRNYYRLHGQRIAVVPDSFLDCPRPDLLQWHNENIYVG
jgi:putative restriction endonuclease